MGDDTAELDEAKREQDNSRTLLAAPTLLNKWVEDCSSVDEVRKRLKDSGALNYKLLCFVQHTGSMMNSGHYKTFVHLPTLGQEAIERMGLAPAEVAQKPWLEANDDVITLRETAPVEYGYIYLYRRNPATGKSTAG